MSNQLNLWFYTVIACYCIETVASDRKTGQMASWQGFRRDAGQTGRKTGRPGKNGMSGNPKIIKSYMICPLAPCSVTLTTR